MKINLKNTILLSAAAAVTLNVIQFYVATSDQAKASFAPNWADAQTASATTATPAPSAVKAASISALPGTDAAGGNGPSLTSTAQVPLPADSTFVASDLLNAGLKPDYASLYLSAQVATGTPWELLAAVHEVETGQSGSTSRTSYAGAEGPMQFMPATFNRYATPGASITDVQASILAAGRLLAAAGASRGDYQDAVYSYNHSWSYVDRVLGIAEQLGL
jgi:membrane-bound lytic murein transglycosylase B